MLTPVLLADVRLLRVAGPDCLAFLQGQLTQDVTMARADGTVLAGWADAKGRLLWCGHLVRLPDNDGGGLGLLVPGEAAEALLAHLRRYVLRSKVEVAVAPMPLTGFFAAADSKPPIDQLLALSGDPARHVRIGWPHGTESDKDQARELAAWHLADIRSGIPSIAVATSGEFIPQMLNLDILGAISFTKGCYTGQEIVARTRYLGRVKRRMLRFSANTAPPAPGAPVYGERGSVGQVVRSAPSGEGSEFLAVIYLDDLPGPFFLDSARGDVARRMELPYAIPV